MVHLPQRGEGPVVQDLLAGTVSVGLSSVATAMPHIASGKVIALAMMGKERSTALPNVPTVAASRGSPARPSPVSHRSP
jgi:tripartite-type tricarboxylate transporter receptor subunit TctC